MPGRDSFTIATYDGLRPSGSPLSEFLTPTAIPMPSPGGALGFTLEGVVDHVVLQYGGSVPTTDANGQIAALPVAVATSAPLAVTPYDAANFQILSQVGAGGAPVPYFAPVTLSVSPSSGGVTLQNDRGSGSSITVADPNDLAVNVSYDGTVGFNAGLISPDVFAFHVGGSTIPAKHARRRSNLIVPMSAPANTGGVALASNVIRFPLGTFSAPVPEGLVNIPGSTSMFYLLDPSVGSVMGSVTSSGSATSTAIAFPSSYPFADSFGHFWAWFPKQQAILCFNSAGSGTPASITAPGGAFIVNGFSGFAQDADGDLWFAFNGTASPPALGSYYEIGYIALDSPTSCSAPVVVTSTTITGRIGVAVTSIAAIPGGNGVDVGADTNQAVSPVPRPQVVFVATTPSPAPSATPVVTAVPIPNDAYLTALAGSSSAVYGLTTQAFTNAAVAVGGGGAVSTIATLPGGLGDIFSGSQQTALSGRSVLALTGFSAQYNEPYVGMIDTADANAALDWEVLVPSGNLCGGVAYDPSGMAWSLCQDGASPASMSLYRILPTSTWSVLPSTTIPVTFSGTSDNYLLSILENIGATSGPFSLQSSSSMITSTTQVGDRGVAVAFSVPSAGTYSIPANVVDSLGRSVPVTFTLTSSAGGGSAARRACPPLVRRGSCRQTRN
jgi:hypothetical protein